MPGRWGTAAHGTHCGEGEAGYTDFMAGTMGDTQTSQTISTESNESAQHRACGGEVVGKGRSQLLVSESSLVRIRMAAEPDPEMVFTSLAQRIDVMPTV